MFLSLHSVILLEKSCVLDTLCYIALVLIAPCAYSTFLLNTPYGVKGGYASLITLGWEGA